MNTNTYEYIHAILEAQLVKAEEEGGDIDKITDVLDDFEAGGPDDHSGVQIGCAATTSGGVLQ